MQIVLIRHGQTEGNLRKAYIGSTDEDLCAQGQECALESAKLFARACPSVDGLYVSPLKRAVQTAQILFPDLEQHVVEDLREMDFGDFEGKSYLDMSDDRRYREWVDGNCEGQCPNGEDRRSFCMRTEHAFEEIVSQASLCREETIAIVAHGGTVMSLLSCYAQPGREYFEWRLGNCEGYLAQLGFSEDGAPILFDVQKIG